MHIVERKEACKMMDEWRKQNLLKKKSSALLPYQ
jgi:hypothetical protein